MRIFHSHGSNIFSKQLVSRLVMASTKAKEQYLKIVGLKSSHPSDLNGYKGDNIFFLNLIIIYFVN